MCFIWNKQITIESFTPGIGGHHIHKGTWSPFVGETLSLAPEPDNPHDLYAFLVLMDGGGGGHARCEFAHIFNFFLKHGEPSLLQ